ncbi:hypothetical protein [Thermocatellispora tengchongensis]|uniref:hypothetical protein n=1 Tax=Thermocatellispora tengchongensis TaxID=1073253 RepID=UPI0031EED517
MARSSRRPARATVITAGAALGVFALGAGLGVVVSGGSEGTMRLAAGTYRLDDDGRLLTTEPPASEQEAAPLSDADMGSTITDAADDERVCLTTTTDGRAVGSSGRDCTPLPFVGGAAGALRPGNPKHPPRPTATPSATGSPTATPSATGSPTRTRTAPPSPRPTPTMTGTPRPSAPPTRTRTPAPTASPRPSTTATGCVLRAPNGVALTPAMPQSGNGDRGRPRPTGCPAPTTSVSASTGVTPTAPGTPTRDGGNREILPPRTPDAPPTQAPRPGAPTADAPGPGAPTADAPGPGAPTAYVPAAAPSTGDGSRDVVPPTTPSQAPTGSPSPGTEGGGDGADSLPVFRDPELLRRAYEALGIGTRDYIDENGVWDLNVAPPGTPPCRDYTEEELERLREQAGDRGLPTGVIPRDSCLWPAFIRWLLADPAPGEVSNWTKFTGLPDRNLDIEVVDPASPAPVATPAVPAQEVPQAPDRPGDGRDDGRDDGPDDGYGRPEGYEEGQVNGFGRDEAGPDGPGFTE